VQDLIEVIDALEFEGRRRFVGHSASGMIESLGVDPAAGALCPSGAGVSLSARHPNDENDGLCGRLYAAAQLDGVSALMENNPTGWPGVLAPMAMQQHPERPELEAELERNAAADGFEGLHGSLLGDAAGRQPGRLGEGADADLGAETERDTDGADAVSVSCTERIAGSVLRPTGRGSGTCRR